MSRSRTGLLYSSWVNGKLPLLIVAGLNLSVISSMLIAIALREYWGICNLIYWKQLSSISENILLVAIILLIPSIIYYCYIRKWKYLIWLLVIGFNPITILWLIINI